MVKMRHDLSSCGTKIGLPKRSLMNNNLTVPFLKGKITVLIKFTGLATIGDLYSWHFNTIFCLLEARCEGIVRVLEFGGCRDVLFFDP